MTAELQALREYIRNDIGYAGELEPDTDLIEHKVLDSFNVVEMALFIQRRFGIELEGEDVVIGNLARLSSMVALIHRKRDEHDAASLAGARTE